MSMAKVSTYRAPDAISDKRTAQLEREGQDPFDNFIIQAIGKEPFLSFSRPGDNSIQWIQLLHALEQQGTLKKGSRVDNMADENDRQQQSIASTSERNALKESGNALKGCGSSREGKNAPEKVQALKIPEAVIAFAQAAAKANGEREKYLPGWPLLSTPSKVQLQKCDKCSREFCSQINYRRHIRVHRRSLNVDKVSPKNRELLAAFWDKLSSDEAKELASFENVTFGDISGPCVLTALGSLMRKPGFSSLPHSYMKAGVTLCDLVEGRPAMFPISAEELFRLLDDASEKTFLSAGTAISLQKFVFDGGAGKIAMEMRNLIACTSFLLEQKLVKAWLADKDAEALRYQKLLFEEEEAAQKRQAELLVRKRMKKLRQKEQKMKENAVTDEAGPEDSRDAVEDASEASCPDMAADGLSLRADLSGLEDGPLSPPKLTDEIHRAEYVDGDWLLNQVAQPQESFRRQQPPSFKSTRNGFSYFHPPPAFARPAAMHRPSGYKDPKNATPFTGQKVWTRKSKPQCVDEQGVRDESAGVGGCEVLIGSISVTLKDTPDLHESQTKPLPEENPGSVGSTGHAPEETTLADSPPAAPEDEQPSRPELFSSKAVMAFLSQRWTAAVSAEHVKVSLPSEPEATAVGDAVLRGESESGTGVPDIPGAHCGQVEDMGVGMAAPAVGFRSKLGAKPERSYRLKYIPKQSITG